MRTELVQSGGINQIALQIREHKAADRVIDQAEVTEMPVKEWNKQAEAKSGAAKKTTSKKAPAKKSTTKKTASGAKKTGKKTTKKKTGKSGGA